MKEQPYKYPPAFRDKMKGILNDEFEVFMESLDEPPPVSIRINPFKNSWKAEVGQVIPWCKNGRYLEERPSFTFDPLFHAGTYYVQEASSMFLEEIWKQINTKGEAVKVLDMCAAPGGKSTHLLSLMTEESLLVSNELIPNRNKILQQNITKWGTDNCIITQNQPEDFAELEDYFDIVLVDAPCSGEGLFRKDKNAVDEWSEKNVRMCSLRQKEILNHAAACLKPGGFLIYSTCTFEPEENDLQFTDTDWQIPAFKISDYGQTRTKYGYQFYPHKMKGEGFYISVMQKSDNETRMDKVKITTPKQDTFLSNIQQRYLQGGENFYTHTKDELLFSIPRSLYSDFMFLNEQLYIRHAGIFVGSMKGNDFIPSHDLALNCSIKPDLPFVELDYHEAIAYLRCEPPKLKTELRGWTLAKFQGMNIGWMKILDGRTNNYFPKEWRILKQP